MSRRKAADKRITKADPQYNSQLVSRFVNRMMQRGKRSTAQSLFYDALLILKDRTKNEPLDVFNKAVKNVTPLVEVKARRVGGSTYQVPVEVKQARGFALLPSGSSPTAERDQAALLLSVSPLSSSMPPTAPALQ